MRALQTLSDAAQPFQVAAPMVISLNMSVMAVQNAMVLEVAIHIRFVTATKLQVLSRR
jgi:hypothetical protein